MPQKSFEQLVQDALERIPPVFQEALKNVAIVIRDRPEPEDLETIEGGEGDVLYGLYLGIPLPERSLDDSGTTPDVIVLYRESLLEDFPRREDLLREIEITLVHEIAHYFGFDEETLEAYGYD